MSKTEDECARCNQAMRIRDGDEPTKYCDHCAHAILEDIEARLEDRAG